MRASKARQVTATTCPLVDIQRSFCSRSASGYFVGNLPQKVKLVNGLTLDLPIRMDRVASEISRVGLGSRHAFATFFLARSATFRQSRLRYRRLHFLHISDVRAPMPFWWPAILEHTRTDRVQAPILARYAAPRRQVDELQCPKRTGRAVAHTRGRYRVGENGAARKRFGRAWVGQPRPACAPEPKQGHGDASQSREERITCPPGRLIQVFIPLRAKRRRHHPNRSPMSPPSIPTENPLTASPSSTSIRNRRRTPRSS